jgi:transcriptional regulator with XRE-family HTH domain
MDTFANNLRRRAEELGISNAEAARRAGLSDRRYGNYVSGRREPDLATLVRIAKVLETTPNALLGIDTPSKATGKGNALRDKIASAVGALDDKDREVLAACAEAIVKMRAK